MTKTRVMLVVETDLPDGDVMRSEVDLDPMEIVSLRFPESELFNIYKKAISANAEAAQAHQAKKDQRK